MPTVADVLADVPQQTWLAMGVLLLGVVFAVIVDRLSRRVLRGFDVDHSVEGTAFERTLQGLGTSTVSLLSLLSMLFIIVVAVVAAFNVAGISVADQFWNQVAGFVPGLFVAVVVLIVGGVVADKVEIVVSERLRGIKLPEATMLPVLAKYSVFYLAGLIALGQVGIATSALLVLLGAYFLGIIVLSAMAFRQLLASGAAGIYLLLNEPYGIGDEVAIGERSGVVQEMDLFVTHVEGEDREHIVPNSHVFDQGIARIRDE